MRKIAVFLSTIFCCTVLHAQQFTKQATIEKAGRSGFHRILLRPEISGTAGAGLQDLRIFDQNRREVPFLYTQEALSTASIQFVEYEIDKKEILRNCCTKLVLSNHHQNKINNISLRIKNAEVRKKAKLTGSDDGQNWYALKENFYLQQINNLTETSELKIVDFPLSNYRYYAIEIDDSSAAPLNILAAGYYDTESESGKFQQIKPIVFSQQDTFKESRIAIRFPHEVLIDKLYFSFSEMPFYLRNAKLQTKQTRTQKNGKTEEYYTDISQLQVSSAKSNTFLLPAVKVKELYLLIDNKDNPPLQISAVEAYQLNRYLSAWFEKDKNYMLKLGAEGLQQPDYDIAYYKDSIPKDIPLLATSSLKNIEKPAVLVASNTFFSNKNIIWAAIIGVIVLLGFMSTKMIKETNARQ